MMLRERSDDRQSDPFFVPSQHPLIASPKMSGFSRLL